MTTSFDRQRQWYSQGWFPAKWKHHPELFKRVYQQRRWRPTGKQCYRNAQRLVIDVVALARLNSEPVPDIQYAEGVVISLIPFCHAWVQLDGVDVEVTLDEPPAILSSHLYSHDDVLANLKSQRCYAAVDENKLIDGINEAFTPKVNKKEGTR